MLVSKVAIDILICFSMLLEHTFSDKIEFYVSHIFIDVTLNFFFLINSPKKTTYVKFYKNEKFQSKCKI